VFFLKWQNFYFLFFNEGYNPSEENKVKEFITETKIF